MAEVELRIRIDDEEDLRAAELVAADSADVTMEATSGPPGDDFDGQIAPVIAIVIGAGVLAAAQFIANWWEKRRGGLVIDLRDGAADEIHRDSDVPWGLVLVFAKDGGTVEVKAEDMPKDTTAQLLEAVLGAAVKSTKDIADAAAKTVGPDKVTEGGDPKPAAVG